MNTKFNRERIRFDVKQPDTLVIQGWFEDDTEGAEQFEAERNGAPAAIDVQVQRGVEVTKKYLRYKTNERHRPCKERSCIAEADKEAP